jgi:hypothetical protein
MVWTEIRHQRSAFTSVKRSQWDAYGVVDMAGPRHAHRTIGRSSYGEVFVDRSGLRHRAFSIIGIILGIMQMLFLVVLANEVFLNGFAR